MDYNNNNDNDTIETIIIIYEVLYNNTIEIIIFITFPDKIIYVILHISIYIYFFFNLQVWPEKSLDIIEILGFLFQIH